MRTFTTAYKNIKARFDHDCCCYEIYKDSGYGLSDIPEKYHKSVIRMEEQRGIIKKGDVCVYWSGRFDGEFFHAYADLDMLGLIIEMGWDEQ